jgi:hypothetical protein
MYAWINNCKNQTKRHVRDQLYNFAKRGVPKRMSVIMQQDSVVNSEYAQDYINITWIQRHNHTFSKLPLWHPS